MKNLNNIENSWVLFWSLTAVFIAITLLPFYGNDFPGLADYSNHLARLHFLTGQAEEGWQEFYSIKFSFIPNLGLDIVGAYFVSLGLSPEVALRLFATITVLLVVGGTYAIALSTHKHPPWLVIWAFTFAFNRYFIWGFLNYFFSLALGFFIFAFWIIARKSPNKNIQFTSKILISLLLILVMLSHLMGYGIAIICIFTYELSKRLSIGDGWKEILPHLIKTGLFFLPSLIFYVLLCDHGAGGELYYDDILMSKVRGILSPFLSYKFMLGPVFILGFLATLFIALKRHYDSFQDYKKFIIAIYPNFLFLTPLALLVLFFVAPSEVMQSSYLDKRMFVPIVLLAVALIHIKLKPKAVLYIIIIALSSHAIKIAEINAAWRIQTAETYKIIGAFNKIETGSSIRSFNFADHKHMPYPPIQHTVSLAAVHRATFVPHLFGRPNTLGSLVFNPPYDQLSTHIGVWLAADSLKLRKNDKMPTTNEECKLYDYSFVSFMSVRPKVPDCFELIEEGKYFALYKRNY